VERVDYESIVVQELLGLHERGELDLNPWYQRRAVWTRPQKAYLINTLFEQKPVPTLYIRHYLDIDREKSIKEVVDGQQRIRCILEYLAGEFGAKHPTAGRVMYDELSSAQKKVFRMTKLSVGYLIEATDSDVIEIFGRLNSVSKNLNAQEKRNAQFSGEFKQFCLRQSADRVNLWRSLGVFSANDVARMQEVQFVSDLCLNMLDGLTDYSAARLNKVYKEFDEEFPRAGEMADRLERVLGSIALLDPATIRDTIFSRQPIFFSLLLVLDEIPSPPTRSKLAAAIHRVDEMFRADIPIAERPEEDVNFINACTASTQRIKSRLVRHAYIRQVLGG